MRNFDPRYEHVWILVWLFISAAGPHRRLAKLICGTDLFWRPTRSAPHGSRFARAALGLRAPFSAKGSAAKRK